MLNIDQTTTDAAIAAAIAAERDQKAAAAKAAKAAVKAKAKAAKAKAQAKAAKAAKAATVKASQPVIKASDLSAIHAAAWSLRGSLTGATAAILAAGAKAGSNKCPDEIKAAFSQSYLARILNPNAEVFTPEMLADAARVLKLPHSKATTKPNRRTMAQDKACGATRAALCYVLRAAGVTTNEARGGANKSPTMVGGKKAKAKADKAAAAIAGAPQVAPLIKAPANVVTFAEQQASMLLTFANKNAKTTPLGIAEAIKAFSKAIGEAAAAFKLEGDATPCK